MSQEHLDYKLCANFKAALGYAVKQPAFRRVKQTRPQSQPLPGITKGPRFDKCRLDILTALGEKRALDFSWVCSTIDEMPTYLSVAHAERFDGQLPPAVELVCRLVRLLTKIIYNEAKDRSFSGFSLPKLSTDGFCWYHTGQDAVLMRRVIINSYKRNLERINQQLANRDWAALMSNMSFDEDYVPLYPVTSMGWRVQPMRALELVYSGGQVVRAIPKPRKVMTYDGMRDNDFSNSYGSSCFTMRPRHINQVSASVNILAQANLQRVRKAIKAHPIWGVSKVDLHVKSAYEMKRLWPECCSSTYDFSRMDESMRWHIYEAFIKGFEDAGMPEATINLLRAIHYSPFFVKDDSTAKGPKRPARLLGNPEYPYDMSLDLGNRSGESSTDIFNKTGGSMTYLAAGLIAGLILGPSGRLDVHNCRDEELEAVIMAWIDLKCHNRDRMKAILNCGDDHGNLYEDEGSEKAYNSALKAFGEYFSIEKEPTLQLLGEEFDSTGARPYLGKLPANILSPERPWDSPMRKDTYGIGLAAQLAHYRENPEGEEVIEIVNFHISKYFSTTLQDILLSSGSPNLDKMVRSTADLDFLVNQDVIHYKYDESEISSDLLNHYFTNISPEEEELLQLL